MFEDFNSNLRKDFFIILFIIQSENLLSSESILDEKYNNSLPFYHCNTLDCDDNSVPSPPQLVVDDREDKTNFETKIKNNQNKKEEKNIKEKKDKTKEEDEKKEENEFNNLQDCSIDISNNINIEYHIYNKDRIIDILKSHNNNNLDKFIKILTKDEIDNNIKIEINYKQNKHNKYSPDNIIKKIKVYLFHYLIIFVNEELIGKNKYKNSKLKKLDYKYIFNTNKEDNINYLKMYLRELLSLEITTKYITKSKNTNEKIIEKMLQKNDEKVRYVLNLRFIEWIDIFIMKKEGNNIVKIDGLHLLLDEILEKNKIEIENYEETNQIENQIENKKEIYDEKYFVNFVYLLYNFENWFKRKKNKKN